VRETVRPAGSEEFRRLTCPEELAGGGEFSPFFNDDSTAIEWVKMGVAGPPGVEIEGESADRIVVENPLSPYRGRPRPGL